MIYVVADVSTACCTVAGLVGCAQRARARRVSWSSAASVAAFVVLATWAAMVAVYARAPLSPLRTHALLTALCLASAPWLAAALSVREQHISAVWGRWNVYLVTHAGVCGCAALVMWFFGVDWITGIGSEPTVVLTGWGLLAASASAASSFVALMLLGAGLPAGLGSTPALLLGMIGATGSVLWVSAGLLWRGYLTLTPLISAVALGAVAALMWTVGLVRDLPAGASLAPSRRLVYGASALSIVLAYVLAARVAFEWIAALARNAVPAILPAFAFAAIAGFVVVGSSKRRRHRLWVAVGRHFFGSKHDYGEVWIRLTELVSAAHGAPELLERAVTFCRGLLCVSEVAAWLPDSGGRLWRAAVAPAGNAAPGDAGNDAATRHPTSPANAVAASVPIQVSTPVNDAQLTEVTRSAFSCPMQVNGRLLGVLTVGSPLQRERLDREDRRVVRYIAAQIASALGLHKLGEEVADAREVGSFHRLSAFVLHDLKNLVAQQSFVIENATKFRDDPAFVNDALAAFEDSTNRMRALIGRLRSQESGGSSTHTTCDLLELLREIIAMPRVALRNGYRVRLVAPEAVESCRVPADRSALAQLFTNLLVNAVESLPAEVGDITISIVKTAGGWRVQVRDNGRGIPEAFQRSQLFRPFCTTKQGGLGIGLYQCKAIVEAAGGTIGVESQENSGTTVTVMFPAPPRTGKGLSSLQA